MTSKNFALLGAGGYIAPRHMQAILDTGNRLAIAYDPSDSVGILDTYFPSASFHTSFERFSAEIYAVLNSDNAIDFMSISSPNDLHLPHAEFGLTAGADVICEKPLVLNPQDLEKLRSLEQQSGNTVSTILQLRLHESIISLKRKIDGELSANRTKRYEVELTYLTSRGAWYHTSWKGDPRRSGGVATNIGIHFFDMLAYLFGPIQQAELHLRDDHSAAGVLQFESADVRWFLSIDSKFLPPDAVAAGKRTYRSIKIDDEEVEFSEGFTDLHTRSYEQILLGEGFGLDVAEPSVNLAYKLRTEPVRQVGSEYHPLLKVAL